LIQNLFEDLDLERFLPKKAMQLAYLLLQGTVLRCRDDLFPCGRRRQRTLGRQPPPGEQLVRSNAMSPRHETDGSAGLVRLLHRIFSDPLQRRRRCTEVMTSIFGERSVIDTVILLTLTG
jgi:hypothetical protein